MSLHRVALVFLVIFAFAGVACGDSTGSSGEPAEAQNNSNNTDPNNNSNNSDPNNNSSLCGNGQLDDGESCDGSLLDGATCETLGHGPGQLGCRADCTDYDRSECGAADTCGDGALQTGETCDGDRLDGATCQSLGFDSGTLGCLANCLDYDESDCSDDGNNQTCEPETCEDLAAQCGSIDDGCGDTLDCGGCSGELSCGGAGEANICGAECRSGCPQGYTCTTQGVCAAGNPDSLIFDVPTSMVTVTTTHNGGAITPNSDCTSNALTRIVFTNLDSGDSDDWFPRCDGSPLNVRLPNGRYKIQIAGRNTDDVPSDIDYLVDDEWVLDGDTQLDIDIETSMVTVPITHNGGAITPNSDCTSNALTRILFTNLDSGDSDDWFPRCDGSPLNVRLPNGRYKVQIAGRNTDDVPSDIDYLVDDEWVLDGDTQLNVDIKTSMVTVPITHNGGAITPNSDCTSNALTRILFTNLDSGDSDDWFPRCDGSPLNVRLPNGRYKVQIAGRNTDDVPSDIDYLVAEEWVLDGDTQLDVDIKTSMVTVPITHNGGAITPNSDCTSNALTRIVFTNLDSGDSDDWFPRCDGSPLNVRLPNGRYKVQIAGRNTDDVPSDIDYLVAEEWVLDGDTQLDVDILTSETTITTTHNGSAITPNGDCTSSGLTRIVLTNLDSEDSDDWYLRCDGNPSTLRLPNGRYKVQIAGLHTDEVPTDIDYLVAEEWVLDGDTPLDIDIPSTEVTLSVTHNGQPVEPNSDCTNSGLTRIVFTNLDSGDSDDWYLRCDGNPSTLRFPHGRYNIRIAGFHTDDLPTDINHEVVWKLDIP